MCQQLGLIPSSPAPGLETTLQPREWGALSPGPWEFTDMGCPHAWSALCPAEHYPCVRELSMRIVASTAAIWGAPSSTPQLRSRQGGGSRPDLHALAQGCRQSFTLLLPRHHTSELALHPTLTPMPQQYRGFKVGDGCMEIMCKYANYFIMSLA